MGEGNKNKTNNQVGNLFTLARYLIDHRTIESINWQSWATSVVLELDDVRIASFLSRKGMPLQVPNGNYEYYLGDRSWRQLTGTVGIPLDPSCNMSPHLSLVDLQAIRQADFVDYAQFVIGEERDTYASYWTTQTYEVGHLLTDSIAEDGEYRSVRAQCTQGCLHYLDCFLPLQLLPEEFLRYLDGEKCVGEATLHRGGKTWLVKVEDSSFRAGWKDFARYHDLRIGDFVVFKHVGNLVFDVMIFDNTYCERDYLSPFGLENNIDDRPKVTKKTKEQGRKKMDIKKQSILVVDSSSMGNLKDGGRTEVPSFKATLMHYNFTQWMMGSFFGVVLQNIPLGFARSNSLADKCCIITLRDENGKSWPVALNHKKSNHRVYIRRGWKMFSDDNKLQKGDICTFKLVSSKNSTCTMEVGISRSNNSKCQLRDPSFI
ncbi:hypothetical protein GIB67_037455 [Kingdonia uniflora]|uniref:TF-B3 domain-containing protein n=1 Tax=Kingdonia uniflora TaxID=39325 RepID=A0A7J7NIY9_9MAGN|nr:hypothetical protein GIB67_037455 [Kingdonia uniflora]